MNNLFIGILIGVLPFMIEHMIFGYYIIKLAKAKLEKRQKSSFIIANMFDTRESAERFIVMMDGLAESFGYISVADIYDTFGTSSNNFNDESIGWDKHDISNARVEKIETNAYQIVMPAPHDIKEVTTR